MTPEQDQKPRASVVILTKNGCPDISDCLQAVFSQTTDCSYETIVIDSGSSDGTLEIVKRYPAQVVEIPPDSFNHGSTRNLGVELARGELVVFLTQDAIPANQDWLDALIRPFQDPSVAGVFSRQLPKRDAHVLTRRSLGLWVAGQDRRLVKRMPHPSVYAQMSPYERYLLATFDNVSSCLRREVWLTLPFAQVAFGEDIDWAQRALEAGHTLVYEPASCVHHSHNRPALYEFKRIYLDHQNLYRLFGLETIPTLRIALLCLFRAWVGYSLYVASSSAPWRAKLWLLCAHIPALVPAEVFGQYLGRHADEFLPRWGWFRRFDHALRRGV
jgi:glycosyltransferase involved in cell wall biosynthesis